MEQYRCCEPDSASLVSGIEPGKGEVEDEQYRLLEYLKESGVSKRLNAGFFRWQYPRRKNKEEWLSID
jgi:hypothetical protein